MPAQDATQHCGPLRSQHPNGACDVAVALNLSRAGIFGPYLKTHMSGAHFRDPLRSHHKLIHFNEVDGGGHFAVWE
jgi:hypothetical protein